LSAAVLANPQVAVVSIVGAPMLAIATRWYLRRAPAGYLWERASYATLNGTVTETVEGARTVEALSLADERIARADADLREAMAAERRTLFLRTVWFPAAELAYFLPVVATLAWGGWLASRNVATAGEVTTVVLYMVQIVDPVDRLVSWLDEIQIGATSLSRLVGVGQVPPDRHESGERPVDDQVRAADVRYAYREGHDVLHGIDLHLHPGERLAIVGPSGAGKSTLGRLLAGIHPPRTGRVIVGGVRLVDLPVERLRREVLLVTQEHHVFVGTLRDNLLLAAPRATDDELHAALAAVGALRSSHCHKYSTLSWVRAGCRSARRTPSRSPSPGSYWPTHTRSFWMRRRRCWIREPPAGSSGRWQ
jgi:ABC-type multidrug transport system fused ATPase/permease subunit